MTHSASASHTVSEFKADLLCTRQVTELRSLIATAGGLPVDRLKLLLRGKALQDGDKAKALQNDGKTHMQVVQPVSFVRTMHLSIGVASDKARAAAVAQTRLS